MYSFDINVNSEEGMIEVSASKIGCTGIDAIGPKTSMYYSKDSMVWIVDNVVMIDKKSFKPEIKKANGIVTLELVKV